MTSSSAGTVWHDLACLLVMFSMSAHLDSTDEVKRYAKRNLLYRLWSANRCHCLSNNGHGKSPIYTSSPSLHISIVSSEATEKSVRFAMSTVSIGVRVPPRLASSLASLLITANLGFCCHLNQSPRLWSFYRQLWIFPWVTALSFNNCSNLNQLT